MCVVSATCRQYVVDCERAHTHIRTHHRWITVALSISSSKRREREREKFDWQSRSVKK